MQLTIRKTDQLSGSVTPPGSKSQTVRAMLLSLLARGESLLYNVPQGDDITAVITVCRQLGAEVSQLEGDGWRIVSGGVPLTSDCQRINSGNSGITTRFVMPMLGLRQNAQQPIVLDCDEQMRRRPVGPLVDVLRQLGLTIDYLAEPERLPISVCGKLSGGKVAVDGLTSQYVSALLLSLPCVEQVSEVRVAKLNERLYVDMTLNWLQQQRLFYSQQYQGNEDIFTIQGGQCWQPQNKIIGADFSSASYLIAAAALLPGKVVINGINMDEPQGDKILITILQQMGAAIEVDFDAQRLIIHGGKPLHGADIDGNEIPDLLPTLAVIATQAQGATCIGNVPHARIKETDRIHSMSEGLNRMGAKVEQGSDELIVYQSDLHGVNGLNGYDDHRTVMALAVAGLLAQGDTTIDGAEAMNKTFPQFVEVMHSLGADMEMSA